MIRRLATIIAVLAVAACSSGGGGVSSGSSPASKTPAAAALSLTLAKGLTSGASAVIAISVGAVSSSGAPITGTYLAPITLSSNDPTDIGFSSSSTGTGASSSFPVTASTEAVYLVYDGAALPSGTNVTASTTTASTVSIALSAPATSASSQPTTPATTIASLSIAANGSSATVGTAGTFTLTVAAYSSTSQLITGTYATPLTVTTNDSSDLQLSIAGGSSGSAVTLTSASQLVLVTYDGKTVPTGTTFTVSAPGVASASAAFTPAGATTGSGASIASITVSQVGAPPILGTAGEFALNVTALSSSAAPINGTYATPILITTNDSKDISLATSAAGPFGSSVTLTTSGTPVLVEYDGGSVPNDTQFAATAGSVSGTLAFNPQPTSTTPYIDKLYVSGSGVSPNGSEGGAIPIFVTAYDQNGNVISGTYPSPVGVTLTDACDEGISLNASVNITPCLANGGVIVNPAALTINSASQVLFLSYDCLAAGGSDCGGGTPTPSYVSVTTVGIQCAAVNFLTTTAPGSFISETCAATVPNAHTRPSSRGRGSANSPLIIQRR